jgi:hypothetical protein
MVLLLMTRLKSPFQWRFQFGGHKKPATNLAGRLVAGLWNLLKR